MRRARLRAVAAAAAIATAAACIAAWASRLPGLQLALDGLLAFCGGP